MSDLNPITATRVYCDVIAKTFQISFGEVTRRKIEAEFSRWSTAIREELLNAAIIECDSRNRVGKMNEDADALRAIWAILNRSRFELNRKRSLENPERIPDTKESESERQILREELTKIVELLDPIDCSIVRMLFLEWKTISDVSQSTGLSERTIYRKMKQAMSQLKSIWESRNRLGEH
jgi:RNA polymerase sigma factor (sigma-70 family)